MQEEVTTSEEVTSIHAVKSVNRDVLPVLRGRQPSRQVLRGRQPSKVLRGVELVLKVSFDLPVKPLAAIHANFV